LLLLLLLLLGGAADSKRRTLLCGRAKAQQTCKALTIWYAYGVNYEVLVAAKQGLQALALQCHGCVLLQAVDNSTSRCSEQFATTYQVRSVIQTTRNMFSETPSMTVLGRVWWVSQGLGGVRPIWIITRRHVARLD
jgi:hypothetical protein